MKIPQTKIEFVDTPGVEGAPLKAFHVLVNGQEVLVAKNGINFNVPNDVPGRSPEDAAQVTLRLQPSEVVFRSARPGDVLHGEPFSGPPVERTEVVTGADNQVVRSDGYALVGLVVTDPQLRGMTPARARELAALNERPGHQHHLTAQLWRAFADALERS